MQKIAVCIPTYKRPQLLLKTINSVCNNNISGSNIGRVDIIVVDNDAERTGENSVKGFDDTISPAFHIHYYNYSKKGLANVRNELLEKAIGLSPEFIIFIDDDEYASPEWLKELVETASDNNADMAVGPVHSVFEKPVPDYISYWFRKSGSASTVPIDTIASNNLIIRTDFLLRSKLRFDQRFNTTGAEDTYFGIEARQAGAKIFSANNALVYETVPDARARLEWLIKRRYRGAITFTYILILEKQYLKLLKKALISMGYLAAGTLGLVLLPFNVKTKYWGILTIVEGYGGLAGLFNVKYHEYK